MHPMIEKIKPYLTQDYRCVEMSITEDNLKEVLEDHKCVWTPLYGSRFYSIGCSVFNDCPSTSYKQGDYCSFCTGRIEITEDLL